jgi:hypothetical protein
MQLRFEKQVTEEAITQTDIVELFNCEDASSNGTYMVLNVEDNGDVTLMGMQEKAGYIMTISLGEPE